MDKQKILNCVVTNHNRLAQMYVNNDNAILLGETLKELRLLVQLLEEDIKNETEESDVSAEEGDTDTEV